MAVNRKLFIGPRLRRLREEQQLTQGQFAQQLGISHSYLNQLENNQRPVTASVLVKLSDQFSLDIAVLAQEQDGKLMQNLAIALKDPLFNKNVYRQDLVEFIEQHSDIANHFDTLYNHYARLKEEHHQLISRFYGEQHTSHLTPLPHEEVRDLFFQHNNYIDELDQAAEDLSARLTLYSGDTIGQLRQYLQDKLKYKLVFSDASEQDWVRRLDTDESTLTILTKLEASQQVFQIASAIASLQHGSIIKDLCEKNQLSEQASSLANSGLAHYFAGAFLMPYQEFLRAAEDNRYDVEYLKKRFKTSTEQVCHRLSSLQRKGQEGVPFYFLRVDQAGNISKRQSATNFHFSKTGGACPLWNIHEAFIHPQKIIRQIAEMPDGQRFFCLALQVAHDGDDYHSPGKKFAIGMGCELQHAHRLVYSDGLDITTNSAIAKIGPGCRVCSRERCLQRAFPPAGKHVVSDPQIQYQTPYMFLGQ
ncbi:MAG: short-chain fatty acyl-CoA regulator family protein [Pseudomonadales bacterium]|nr:short-chain fatty acyl-CoA regulator family protein [Pseudomonadales bacterium]